MSLKLHLFRESSLVYGGAPMLDVSYAHRVGTYESALMAFSVPEPCNIVSRRLFQLHHGCLLSEIPI